MSRTAEKLSLNASFIPRAIPWAVSNAIAAKPRQGGADLLDPFNAFLQNIHKDLKAWDECSAHGLLEVAEGGFELARRFGEAVFFRCRVAELLVQNVQHVLGARCLADEAPELPAESQNRSFVSVDQVRHHLGRGGQIFDPKPLKGPWPTGPHAGTGKGLRSRGPTCPEPQSLGVAKTGGGLESRRPLIYRRLVPRPGNP
jgi:hypothetical protein